MKEYPKHSCLVSVYFTLVRYTKEKQFYLNYNRLVIDLVLPEGRCQLGNFHIWFAEKTSHNTCRV